MGVVGHTFPPPVGIVHFDNDETWVLGNGTQNDINILEVMTHEFGHVLGLDHSPINEAVMAPFYKGYEPYFALDIDDVRGIQSVYG